MNSKTVKPSANVSFPVEPDDLIEVRDHTVVAGIVDRSKASYLGGWNSGRKQGVYVLLSDITDGCFTIYVGYTSGDFQQRFTRDHLRTKDFWSRAVMFVPASEHGISSTEALWLEGNLVDEFTSGSNVTVTNIKHTGDRSIKDTDLYGLHMMTESILRVLSLLGYSVKEQALGAPSAGHESGSERVKPVEATPGAPIGKPPVIGAPPVLIKTVADNSSTGAAMKSETNSGQEIPKVIETADLTENKKTGFFSMFNRKEKEKPVVKEKPKKVKLTDEEKFNLLRKWRIEEMHKFTYAAPYYVFDDLTLKEIIRVNPKNKNQLITVSGIGDVKLKRHGESLLEVLKEM